MKLLIDTFFTVGKVLVSGESWSRQTWKLPLNYIIYVLISLFPNRLEIYWSTDLLTSFFFTVLHVNTLHPSPQAIPQHPHSLTLIQTCT